MERQDIINSIYNKSDESMRLIKTRHGQLEYLTTVHFIHRLVPAGSKVLEIGAGTGRYSIDLAKEGYDVTAVELVERNLEILRNNATGIKNMASFQGDATNLDMFSDNCFNATFVFGPMYHLYDEEDQHKALDEAIRVTKPGGIIMTAFLSVYAILYNNYLSGNFSAGMDENFDSEYRVRHFKEQFFTGFDIKEFEKLFEQKPVQKVTVLGTDSILELMEDTSDFEMSDDDFKLFNDYHLHTCENRELLGTHSHLLHICKKNK